MFVFLFLIIISIIPCSFIFRIIFLYKKKVVFVFFFSLIHSISIVRPAVIYTAILALSRVSYLDDVSFLLLFLVWQKGNCE